MYFTSSSAGRRTITPRQYIPAEGSHTHLISLRIICPSLLEKNLRFPSSPLTMQRLALELSGGANVQRLNNAGIDCRNDVYDSV